MSSVVIETSMFLFRWRIATLALEEYTIVMVLGCKSHIVEIRVYTSDITLLPYSYIEM